MKVRSSVAVFDAEMPAVAEGETTEMVCGLLPFPLMVARVVAPNEIVLRCLPLLLSQVKSTRRMLIVVAEGFVMLI